MKLRPGACFASRAHAASGRGDHLMNDGEPESRAARLRGEERIENAIENLRRDAAAAIGDNDLDELWCAAVRRAFRLDRDRSARRRRVAGIEQKVDEHL